MKVLRYYCSLQIKSTSDFPTQQYHLVMYLARKEFADVLFSID